jgi:sigma-B regulation protein RsbU (phosphoserine phosphatase)
VGGDWYDYIPLPDGKLAVVVADVSGKGMAAALLMSSTRSLVRLLAQQVMAPSAVLKQLNEVLLRDFPRSKFVTMIYAVLDPANKTLRFASAGHNPSLFISPVRATFIEGAGGLPLGIGEGTFDEQSLSLSTGTGFLMYSDGVSETSNLGGEEFGASRIQRHFEYPGRSVESLLREVYQFTEGVQPADDATVVLIQTN